MQASAVNLEKHVRALTDDIGIRLAGSPEEYKAAEYIRNEFLKYSPDAVIEEYPVRERCVESEKLEVCIDGKWEEFPCSLFSSATDTQGKTVTGDLVFFDTATGYQRPDLSFLTGKAVVHLGCHIEDENSYRRLMEAKPAFILFVDTRYTGTIPLADGLFPVYVKKYGAVPSLNVAYFDAWKWLKTKASSARIAVTGGTRLSKTTVVVCEIKGTDPDSGIIYAGGHHDTQASTVGADDNAIGSAAMIELARLLSQTPHKRTFRLISFGAEEQLSVGSASYVRAHREEIEKNGIFMCNFDSFGSALGWMKFTMNTTPELNALIAGHCHAHDVYYTETSAPCPYTDQFPFAACKVPGIWINRPNCTAGCYYHHRVDNTPDVLGFETAAHSVSAGAAIMAELADREDLSGLTGIPADQQKLIDELFNAVYGGF